MHIVNPKVSGSYTCTQRINNNMKKRKNVKLFLCIIVLILKLNIRSSSPNHAYEVNDVNKIMNSLKENRDMYEDEQNRYNCANNFQGNRNIPKIFYLK